MRLYIGILNPYYKYILHLQRTLTDLALIHISISTCFQNTENYPICAQRSHPPSKPPKQVTIRKTSDLFGWFAVLLLLYTILYFTVFVSVSTSFLFIIYLLLSMSSVLSSLMHYISFTFKQSLTALSNACSSAFNLFFCLLFTSTYSHRCIKILS